MKFKKLIPKLKGGKKKPKEDDSEGRRAASHPPTAEKAPEHPPHDVRLSVSHHNRRPSLGKVSQRRGTTVDDPEMVASVAAAVQELGRLKAGSAEGGPSRETSLAASPAGSSPTQRALPRATGHAHHAHRRSVHSATASPALAKDSITRMLLRRGGTKDSFSEDLPWQDAQEDPFVEDAEIDDEPVREPSRLGRPTPDVMGPGEAGGSAGDRRNGAVGSPGGASANSSPAATSPGPVSPTGGSSRPSEAPRGDSGVRGTPGGAAERVSVAEGGGLAPPLARAPPSAPGGPANPWGADETVLPGSLRPPLPRAEETDELLGRLTAEERARVDPGMASRYVRATNGDLDHSLRRLRETLQWYDTDRPTEVTCEACGSEPSSHYMQVFGWDSSKRPAIYSCLSVATDRDLDANRVHMVGCFEQAIAAMQPGVESWGWVLDMHGFGLRDLDPRLAYAFLKISSSYYPERLAHAFIIGAPRLFSGFWKGISPFIDPKTKEKITFAHFKRSSNPQANAKLKASLARFYPEESIAWLLAEMAENRVRTIANAKAYPMPDLVRLAEAPRGADAADAAIDAARQVRLAARRAHGHPEGTDASHDILGTETYQREMRGRPDRIPPHLFIRAQAQAKGTGHARHKRTRQVEGGRAGVPAVRS